MSQVARKLGISAATLQGWKSRYGRFGADGNAPGGSVEENRRLRQEVQYLERQRDILRKAALILGESPR